MTARCSKYLWAVCSGWLAATSALTTASCHIRSLPLASPNAARSLALALVSVHPERAKQYKSCRGMLGRTPRTRRAPLPMLWGQTLPCRRAQFGFTTGDLKPAAAEAVTSRNPKTILPSGDPSVLSARSPVVRIVAVSILLLDMLLLVPPAGAVTLIATPATTSSTVEAAASPFTDSAILPHWLLAGGSTVPEAPAHPRDDGVFVTSSLRPSHSHTNVGTADGFAFHVVTPPRYCLFCALLR
jgi:hypothetical protein